MFRVIPTAARSASFMRPAMPAMGNTLRSSFHTSPTPKNKEESKDFLSTTTGKTGSVVLGAGLAAVALSKELIIFHEETLVLCTSLAFLYTAYKVGAEGLDTMFKERAREIYTSLAQSRIAKEASLKEQIEDETSYKHLPPTIAQIMDVHQDNIDLQYELELREMKHETHDLIKGKLDKIVQLEAKIRAAEQEQIVDRLEAAVTAHFRNQKADVVLKDAIAALGSVKL
eukprot:CFRG5217T1